LLAKEQIAVEHPILGLERISCNRDRFIGRFEVSARENAEGQLPNDDREAKVRPEVRRLEHRGKRGLVHEVHSLSSRLIYGGRRRHFGAGRSRSLQQRKVPARKSQKERRVTRRGLDREHYRILRGLDPRGHWRLTIAVEQHFLAQE